MSLLTALFSKGENMGTKKLIKSSDDKSNDDNALSTALTSWSKHGAFALRGIAEALSRPNLEPRDLAAIFYVLDKGLKKPVADCREAARERLLELAQAKPDGRLELAGYVVKRTARRSAPDQGALEALLRRRKIPVTDACTQIVSYQLDHAKLMQLVGDGKLTEAEIEGCRKDLGATLSVEHTGDAE